MADFVGSSQASTWLFTSSELERVRSEANSGAESEALGLTAEQRALLLRHFEQCLLRLTAALRFDETLQASAVMFFKRFYVHNALHSGAPFDIAPAALALAIKTEACPYNEVPQFLGAAAKALGTDTGTLMANEMAFMTGIKFNLTLHHPYKALRGLMADLKAKCNLQLTSTAGSAVQPAAAKSAAAASRSAEDVQPRTIPMHEWRTLASRARLFIMHSLTTDCSLLFTPSQVALAALQLAVQSHSSLHPPLNEAPPPALATIAAEYAQSLLHSAGESNIGTAAPVPSVPSPQAVPAAASALLAAAASPDVSATALPLLGQVAPAAEQGVVFGSKAFLERIVAPPPMTMPSGPSVPVASSAAGAGPTAPPSDETQGAPKKRRT